MAACYGPTAGHRPWPQALQVSHGLGTATPRNHSWRLQERQHLASVTALCFAAFRTLRKRRPTGRAAADGVLWLGQEDLEDLKSTSQMSELPVLPVEDVYLPGAPVTLQVTDPLVCELYDNLLLSGGRYVATVLCSEDRRQMAAFGTLLYLEDFRQTAGLHVAEHLACGRVRLKGPMQTTEDGFVLPQRMEVELREDLDDSEAQTPATRLEPQLSQLERLRKKRGITSGLKETLHLEPQLPRELQAVQGLWQVKSGLRVRIDRDQVVGLGKLELSDGRLVVKLEKPFTASIEGSESMAESLTWDDGDVWQRLAAPAPQHASAYQNALWRAARNWRSTGTLRAELRRGEARWKSAASMTQAGAERPWDPDSSSRDEWESAANAADSAARAEISEEVLRPCQQLLQAEVMAERLEIFRTMLQAEITRLQLLQTLDPKD